MRYLLPLPLVLVVCACGTTNGILPKTGNALLAVKNSYEEVEQARVALEGVYAAFCTPDALPVTITSGVCPKVRSALDGVKSGTTTAATALNVAIEAYTAVNDLVGAP